MTEILNAANNDCNEMKDCSCVPFEFARPRFYYGQRLSALDFSDWVWYHAGKQRFHNLHAHGVGVLCGLRAERYEFPQQDTSTVLKVTKGAALDSCGREVIVSVDQCIDIGAWYLQHRHDPVVVDWLESEEFRLCIGLRYAECPSDPSPAPRDPCGCNDGGCEYARVREGFELKLFAPIQMRDDDYDQTAVASPDPFEVLLNIVKTNRTPLDNQSLMTAARAFNAIPCATATGDPWLWLACFRVELSANQDQVVNVVEIDNTIQHRLFILSTEDLQSILLGLLADAINSGEIGAGPQIGQLEFEGADATSGRLTLAIKLALDVTGLAPILLNEATFDSSFINLQRLDPAVGWQAANPGAGGTVAYVPDPQPHLLIEWVNDLTEGDYRLVLSQPEATPITDEKMQPLRPLVYTRQFKLVDIDGTLTLESII